MGCRAVVLTGKENGHNRAPLGARLCPFSVPYKGDFHRESPLYGYGVQHVAPHICNYCAINRQLFCNLGVEMKYDVKIKSKNNLF